MAAVLVHGQGACALRQVVDERDLGQRAGGSLDRRSGEGAVVGPHPGLRTGRHDPDLRLPHPDGDVAAGQHLGDPQGLLEGRWHRTFAARPAGHDQRARHVGVERAVEGVLPGGEGGGHDQGLGVTRRDDQVEDRVSLGPDRHGGDGVGHEVVVHDGEHAALLERHERR